MKKKLIALLCATIMVVSATACGNTENKETSKESNTVASSEQKESTAVSNQETTSEEESAYPEWLNLDAYYPLVKEGTDITLKVVIIDDNNLISLEPEERYFPRFVEEIMNIDLDITQISSDAAGDYLNMLFASDDLPDLLFTSKALTTEQLTMYGVQEGQLLDFAPYMNDAALMPAFNEMCEVEPTLKANMTASDGGIYSQVTVADPDAVGGFDLRMANVEMLAEAGVKTLPKTLDEFIDAMYAVKEKFPESTPLGGIYSDASVHGLLLNALGVNDSADISKKGLYKVGVRNETVTIPAADREIFGEFLKIMNQFYEDEIIHRDYFTMDWNAHSLNVKSGLYSVWCGKWLDAADPENTEKYEMIPALTSEFNDKAFVGHPSIYTVGKCVASAKTEYPELIARFCDYFYTKEGNHLSQFGPFEAQEELLIDGMGGMIFTEEGTLQYVDAMSEDGSAYDGSHKGNGKYEFNYQYYMQLFASQALGNKRDQIPFRYEANNRTDVKTDYDNWLATEGTLNSYWRVDAYEDYMPVREYGLPILYFDGETSTRLAELYSVFSSHMETETVKFITGERSLSELDAYFDELDELGYQEYIKEYQDAYAVYLSNL